MIQEGSFRNKRYSPEMGKGNNLFLNFKIVSYILKGTTFL